MTTHDDELTAEHEKGKDGEVLPPEKESHKKIVTHATRTVHYSGPLPPASEFRQYNDILPGAAERLMIMAEKEQARRLQAQDTIINANIRTEHRGQIIAALLAMAFIVIAIILIIARQYAHAVAVMALIAGVASAFIYKENRKAQQQNEQPQKQEEPPDTP